MIDLKLAVAFLDGQPRLVERAWAGCIAGTTSTPDVAAALATYQNPDGGFGQNLEVDIKAPDSQPFAARLAMLVAIDCGVPATDPVVSRLAGWLESEQGDDGCWRFPPTAFDHPIAPWFAGWTFPSLNPALCLAGCAKRLGIGSSRLFSRVERLATDLAKRSEAETGEFYEVLPYAEYFPWVDHPRREEFLDFLVRGIQSRIDGGSYEDAGHMFEHVGGADSPIARRLPPDMIKRQLDRLESEQASDGGWLSPYDPLWRSWATAHALSVLRAYGRI